MRTFAVIDLSNLFYRMNYVASGEDAYTRAAMSLMIVFRSLKKMHRDLKADHMVFCVDSGSWRYTAYPAYKARRRLARSVETPSQQEEGIVFQAAISDMINFLSEKTACTVLSKPLIEGDDFVARWVQTHPDDQHIIVSGDSDFIQLLAPNVRIYDGVNDRMIACDGVIGPDGKRCAFSVASASGKLKVGKADPNFVAPEEWWREALFLKIIRGDSGDGIFSANPGVRYIGSAKRIGIREAWEDRTEKGFHWNNFMLQRWSMPVGLDDLGNKITQDVRVIDQFEINRRLIDLTAQPDEIKSIMDAAIELARHKPKTANVGFHFLKFCGRYEMLSLAKEVIDHSAYLNAGYIR